MVSPVVWVFPCCFADLKSEDCFQLGSCSQVTVLFKVIDFTLTLEFGVVSKYCCQLHADSSPLRLK